MVAITANTWHYRLTPEEQKIVLGALLHDIGKVCVGFSTEMDHAKWGRKLVEEIKDTALPADIKRDIITMVIDHHIKTINEKVKIVRQADRISAGERTSRDDKKKNENSNDKEDNKKEKHGDRRNTPLLSILSTVFMETDKIRVNLKKNDSSLGFFPLVSLDDFIKKMNADNLKDFMPSERANTIKRSRDIREEKDSLLLTEVYKKIKEDLVNAINSLNYRHPFFLDALDAVLMRYLIFVPSAVYKDIPDISLYHHLKMTAAIALILYRTRNTPYKNKIALIEGDISGIQNFIFYTYRGEGSEKGTAKRLRGRSFYISLLTDAVVRYILYKLKLTPFNVVSKGGGHFMILAPCTGDIKDKVKKIQHNINKFLYARYGGVLKIVIGVETESIESENSIKKNKNWFVSLLEKVKVEIEKRKLQMEIFNEISGETPVREEEVCRVCGLRKAMPNEKEDEFLKCEECFRLEKIGEKVVNSSFIKLTLNPSNEENTSLMFQFENDFSISYKFLSNIRQSDTSGGFILVLRPPEGKGNMQPFFGYHLTGNYAPVVKDDKNGKNRIKTFEELTKVDDSDKENAYLAVFKADVDNLGLIFTDGLRDKNGQEDRISPSRIATLSFQLDLFFTRVVDVLASAHNCYVVFSGGDDLTVMGRVDNLLSFACALRNAFSLWSRNDKVTLSGGIYFNSHKFPAFRMIGHAGEALEKSKQNLDKNSITVFDETLPWPVFMKAVQLYEILKEYIPTRNEDVENNKDAYLSRSVLYRLLIVEEHALSHDDYQRLAGTACNLFDGRKIIVNPDIYFYYIISRNWKKKRSEEDREKLKEFLNTITQASKSREGGGYLSIAIKMFLLLSRFKLNLEPRAPNMKYGGVIQP